MTAFEPGASDVFTTGLTVSPFATALRASSPAPTITVGLEVFVHDVIAAIATDAWLISAVRPPASIRLAGTPTVSGKAARKLSSRPDSATRSCGRRGPASDGSTVPRSSSSSASNSGPSPGSRHRPCALA